MVIGRELPRLSLTSLPSLTQMSDSAPTSSPTASPTQPPVQTDVGPPRDGTYPTDPAGRRQRWMVAWSYISAALFAAVQMTLAVVFLSVFWNDTCDQNLRLYFFLMVTTDVVYSVPQLIVGWCADPLFNGGVIPAWNAKPFLVHVRSFWTACQVVQAAAFLYANACMLRTHDCPQRSPHLFWLMVSETIFLYAFFVLPCLGICLLGLIFRKRILEARRQQQAAAAANGGAGRDARPAGLTVGELGTLKTFLFGELHKSFDAVRGSVDITDAKTHDLEARITTGAASSSDPESATTPPRRLSMASSAASVEVCSICISEYSRGERLRELACGHRFHAECIDGWLLPDPTTGSKGHRTCPLCVGPAVREDPQPAEDVPTVPQLLNRLEHLNNMTSPREGGEGAGEVAMEPLGGSPRPTPIPAASETAVIVSPNN